MSWLTINRYKIWILKTLIPHVVDPAHPPINIKLRKKIKGKFPQPSNLPVTYPVPVKIEITLKKTDLILNSVMLLFCKVK